MHKASITKDQFTRRYSLLDTLTPLHATPLRLIDVARWHKSQEPEFQTALEQAEPTTWLKHLQKNRKTSVRSPWQLTARVMEEYVHALDGRIATASVNEDFQIYTPSRNSLSPPGTNLFPVTSHGSSHVSFDPSLSRRLSFEGRISFEPLTRSTRDSLDVLSRLSAESSYSSPGSRSPKRRDMALPNGGRWPDDHSTRMQRRLTRESERITSTKNSLSEVSELNIAGGSNPFQFDKRTTEPETFVTPGSDLQVAFQRLEGNGITLPNIMEAGGASQLESIGAVASVQSDRLAPWIRNKRRKRINQEKLRREYESKAQCV